MAAQIQTKLPSQRVVSVGTDAELLWLRDAVLQSAGFQVLTTADENHALMSIRRREWDVLLVCYSLSYESRQRLADAFKRCWPRGRVVAVTNKKIDKPDFADAFVYGVEGPEALIAAICD